MIHFLSVRASSLFFSNPFSRSLTIFVFCVLEFCAVEQAGEYFMEGSSSCSDGHHMDMSDQQELFETTTHSQQGWSSCLS